MGKFQTGLKVPTILLALGILVVGLGATIWAIQNADQPGAKPSHPEIPRVSVVDALAAWDSEAAVFVDVRDRNVYDSAHVPGSLSIPLATIESEANTLDPRSWIIPYCT